MRKKSLIIWVVPVIILVLLVSVTTASGCRPKLYNDGTYKGISQADDKGYAVADVTIQRDRITAVTLKEVTELGVDKDYATYPYAPAKEANVEMAKRFVGKQDTKGVDAYTGATSSSKKYIEAVNFALEKARKTPMVKTTYFDGTFYGRSKSGETGYGVAWVTMKGDKITAVKLDDVTEKGVFKDWVTYPYPKALEAKDAMEKRFVEKGSAAVDVFSGATTSSTHWMEAVSNALTNARVR